MDPFPARHAAGYDSAMSINPTPDDIVTPPQPTLAWPGTDENCPKCHGERQVYLPPREPTRRRGFRGKRVTCPVCAGPVRDPLQSFGPDQPSDRRQCAKVAGHPNQSGLRVPDPFVLRMPSAHCRSPPVFQPENPHRSRPVPLSRPTTFRETPMFLPCFSLALFN
jgi:hypothetical protein